jgi:hypothetical protein
MLNLVADVSFGGMGHFAILSTNNIICAYVNSDFTNAFRIVGRIVVLDRIFLVNARHGARLYDEQNDCFLMRARIHLHLRMILLS